MNRRWMAWGLAFGVVGAIGFVGAHQVAFADGEPGATEVSGAQAEWMGPLHGLGEALDTLQLRADQRAGVEQLKAEVRAQLMPVRAAHERASEAVAASVEAGAFESRRHRPGNLGRASGGPGEPSSVRGRGQPPARHP